MRLPSRGKTVTTMTIEHGVIKLLKSRGLKVLDYRVMPANPRFFREGLVDDSIRVGEIVRNAAEGIKGRVRKAAGAIPGFQDNLQYLELPRAAGLNPKVAIPQEVMRSMGSSMNDLSIGWHQLPDRLDRTGWLVASASRRTLMSSADTAQRAGLKLTTLEPRCFALARAFNQPEGVIAWVAPDGCDVVIVRESLPVEKQSLFWGAESVESDALVIRLTEIVGRTVAGQQSSRPYGSLSDEAPLYVCGSPIGREPEIASRLAANLERPVGEVAPPLRYAAKFPDFPVQDLIVNIGLALREA